MRLSRIALAALILGGAAAAALSGHWPWRRLNVEAPGGLEAVPAGVDGPEAPPRRPPAVETLDTLHRGETISDVLARHNITDLDFAHRGRDAGIDPRRLRPGLVLSFHGPDASAPPTRIRLRSSPEQVVTFQRSSVGWEVNAREIVWHSDTMDVRGGIDNSLYEALDGQVRDSVLAGPERVRLAWDLADVFAWEVDFTRDVQPGDTFNVVFERLVSPEGEVRFGRILASELSVAGKSLTAFRFDPTNTLYDSDGRSLRRAFLRAPVQFRRISSAFSRARYHPILGRWRRHEGTDYAAARGTPVMAAGDGTVLRAGRAGGYGNLVELKHRNDITTRYGHLQGFARGIHRGAHVTQGQVIGYVGATGLATGPHLHYEFRVNGVARDSRRVDLGSGAPVPKADRDAFFAVRDRLTLLLHPAGPEPAPPPAIAGATHEHTTAGLTN
ncbi:MAG TPA: M23 family metallopeptidase [Gemmatimonadales bacterium]|nr:M23 family metallopeptidase [Gemmatimonadales bacterium]